MKGQPYLRRLSDDVASCNRGGQPTAYFGDREDWVLALAMTRDDDVPSRSNFRVLLKQLGGQSDTVYVERFSHWAVGWIDYLLVAPSDRDRLRRVWLARKAIRDYPILDESDFSELETEECETVWRDCYNERDRLDYLRQHAPSAPFKAARAAIKGSWWDASDLLPCPYNILY